MERAQTAVITNEAEMPAIWGKCKIPRLHVQGFYQRRCEPGIAVRARAAGELPDSNPIAKTVACCSEEPAVRAKLCRPHAASNRFSQREQTLPGGSIPKHDCLGVPIRRGEQSTIRAVSQGLTRPG